MIWAITSAAATGRASGRLFCPTENCAAGARWSWVGSSATIRGGRNTTLVCTNLVDLFYLNGCSRVTMRDFTVDYDPLPFTQGTITAIDRAKKVIRYRLHAGYPRLEKRYLVHHPLFFGKQTRTMKYDRIWSHCRDNRMLSPEEGELQMEQIQPNLEVGDFVVLNYRPGCIMKIRGMSDSLKFENLTFHSSPGGGIFARRTRGRHEIRNCRMVRGPRPAGASEERLLSLSADGINYATSRQGPLIEGNEIAFIGDDSVNLHGSPLRVVRREKESKTCCWITGKRFVICLTRECLCRLSAEFIMYREKLFML